jgi:hypothetical protein
MNILPLMRAAFTLVLCLAASALAQTTTLYTKPVSGAGGGIAGKVEPELTHAIALNRDYTQCFRGELSDGNKAFRIAGLPTGKYDLILVTKGNEILESVDLGEDGSKLPAASVKNSEARIVKADTFFPKSKIHRFGLIEGGEKMMLFVERVRDTYIYRQDGTQLKSNLRRIEVVELIKAKDEWQMLNTRHIYREEAPLMANMAFFTHKYLPELGNVRVIDSVKDLGNISVPK